MHSIRLTLVGILLLLLKFKVVYGRWCPTNRTIDVGLAYRNQSWYGGNRYHVLKECYWRLDFASNYTNFDIKPQVIFLERKNVTKWSIYNGMYQTQLQDKLYISLCKNSKDKLEIFRKHVGKTVHVHGMAVCFHYIPLTAFGDVKMHQFFLRIGIKAVDVASSHEMSTSNNNISTAGTTTQGAKFIHGSTLENNYVYLETTSSYLTYVTEDITNFTTKSRTKTAVSADPLYTLNNSVTTGIYSTTQIFTTPTHASMSSKRPPTSSSLLNNTHESGTTSTASDRKMQSNQILTTSPSTQNKVESIPTKVEHAGGEHLSPTTVKSVEAKTKHQSKSLETSSIKYVTTHKIDMLHSTTPSLKTSKTTESTSRLPTDVHSKNYTKATQITYQSKPKTQPTLLTHAVFNKHGNTSLKGNHTMALLLSTNAMPIENIHIRHSSEIGSTGTIFVKPRPTEHITNTQHSPEMVSNGTVSVRVGPKEHNTTDSQHTSLCSDIYQAKIKKFYIVIALLSTVGFLLLAVLICVIYKLKKTGNGHHEFTQSWPWNRNWVINRTFNGFGSGKRTMEFLEHRPSLPSRPPREQQENLSRQGTKYSKSNESLPTTSSYIRDEVTREQENPSRNARHDDASVYDNITGLATRDLISRTDHNNAAATTSKHKEMTNEEVYSKIDRHEV